MFVYFLIDFRIKYVGELIELLQGAAVKNVWSYLGFTLCEQHSAQIFIVLQE